MSQWNSTFTLGIDHCLETKGSVLDFYFIVLEFTCQYKTLKPFSIADGELVVTKRVAVSTARRRLTMPPAR